MKDVYLIYSAFEEEPLGIIFGKEEAEAYCEKYSLPESRSFRLKPTSIDILDIDKCPWAEDILFGTCGK